MRAGRFVYPISCVDTTCRDLHTAAGGEIGNPTGTRWEPVEALVDMGATYTSVPAPVLEGLGVVPHTRARFVSADGRDVERAIGRTWVQADGSAEMTLVVFAEPGAPVRLGAHALEGLRLAADPVGRRLVPVPALRA